MLAFRPRFGRALPACAGPRCRWPRCSCSRPQRCRARAFEVVLNAQGEFLDAYLVNGKAFPPRVVFIDPDPPDPSSLTVPPRVGRHVNGKLCFPTPS